MRTRLQSTNSERETFEVHVTLNIPSLLAKAKTRRIPLQTRQTMTLRHVMGNLVIHDGSANTDRILVTPVEDLVTFPKRARANLRKFTGLKSRSPHRAPLHLVLQIHFRSPYTTLVRRKMASKYQFSSMEPAF